MGHSCCGAEEALVHLYVFGNGRGGAGGGVRLRFNEMKSHEKKCSKNVIFAAVTAT